MGIANPIPWSIDYPYPPPLDANPKCTCGPKQFVCPNPRTHIMPSVVFRWPCPMFVSDSRNDSYSKLGLYLQFRRAQTHGSSHAASRMPVFMNRFLSSVYTWPREGGQRFNSTKLEFKISCSNTGDGGKWKRKTTQSISKAGFWRGYRDYAFAYGVGGTSCLLQFTLMLKWFPLIQPPLFQHHAYPPRCLRCPLLRLPQRKEHKSYTYVWVAPLRLES